MNGSKLKMHYSPIRALKANSRNSRTHSKRHIGQSPKTSVSSASPPPILIDKHHTILAGHGRAGAAKLLGMLKVPTIFRKGVPRI